MSTGRLVAIVVALVAVAAGTFVYFAEPQLLLALEFDRQARIADVRERDIQAARHRWSFYDGGRGEPIVLVHGFSGSKENWLPTARHLTDRHRVVIPDLPGWNDTTRVEGADYTIMPQVERLASFLDQLGLRRVVLVGHSMGGSIAGTFAARYPDRVAALVLVSSAGVHFEENDFARAVRGGATPFNFDDREGFDAFMRELFVDPPFLPGRLKDVLIDENRANHGFHESLLRPLSADATAFILEREMRRVRAPTTVAWCNEDRILDWTSTATFVKLKRDTKVELIGGCGHMPMMEKPRELARIILEAAAPPSAP